MREFRFTHSANTIGRWTYNLLVKWGVAEELAAYINLFALLFLLIIIIYVFHHVVRRILRIVLIRFSKRSKIKFFHHLLNNRFPHFLAQCAPLLLVNALIPVIFLDFPDMIKPMNAITDSYMVFIVIWMIMA